MFKIRHSLIPKNLDKLGRKIKDVNYEIVVCYEGITPEIYLRIDKMGGLEINGPNAAQAWCRKYKTEICSDVKDSKLLSILRNAYPIPL